MEQQRCCFASQQCCCSWAGHQCRSVRGAMGGIATLMDGKRSRCRVILNRASLSPISGAAAGYCGHSAAASSPRAGTGQRSGRDLPRWLRWRLCVGRITQPAWGPCSGESPACCAQDLFSICSHLSLISNCLRPNRQS